MLVPPESSSAVLVVICRKSVSICNRSLARFVDSRKNRTFWRGTQIWRSRTEDSLKLGGRTLHRWNLRLMPNISCAGCSGLSRTVSGQFTLEMCIAARNLEKFTKNPYFWCSRSFKFIDVGTAGKVVSSACYDRRQVYRGFKWFFCYFRLRRTLRVNFHWNILEIDQDNRRTKLNWCCGASHEH